MTEFEQPRCRQHPSEPKFTCRMCRSEAIADHDSEPENTAPLAPVIPIKFPRATEEATP